METAISHRRFSVLCGWVLTSMLLAVPVLAMEHDEIVERALAKLDNDFRDFWAYTETSTRDESRYVATYDPRRSEKDQWKLVSVDERDPTGAEIKSFLATKSDPGDEESDDQFRAEVGFQPNSLTLLEETREHWLFSFVPAENGDDQKFMRHIDGTVKVVKDGHYIEYVDLRNGAPFKPAMGVKVKTFESHLTFNPTAAQGPVVPKSVDLHVTGRAYLVIKFEHTEKVRYLDYEYVGAE